METLQGKNTLLTGAGSGIGRAIALSFADSGANLVLVGRTIDSLEETMAIARERSAGRGGTFFTRCCDVSDRSAVNELAVEFLDELGTIDVVVNNAGLNTSARSVFDVDPGDWDKTVDVNLSGVYNVVRGFLPAMRKRKAGTIINIASTAGLRTSEFAGAAYSAAKHGVISLTYSINEEESRNGIRASAICPGETNTPIMDQRPEPPSPELRSLMLAPEDVASAAVFVASLPQNACVPLLVIKPLNQPFG